MSSAGQQLRKGAEMLMKQFGGPVAITKGISSEEGSSRRNAQAAKNKNTFTFLDRGAVSVGEVIQQVGSNELWTVTGVEEHITGGVFVNLRVTVERVG